MKLDYPMMANGMYLLKKEDFDVIAMQVLAEYYPDALVRPQPLDIDYLVKECLYLDVKDVYLTANEKILGMIAFADTKIPSFDGSYQPTIVEAKEGTMLLDASLLRREKWARRRFTEAHEASHWICHRSYHSSDKRRYEFRKNMFVACRTETIERYPQGAVGKRSNTDWEEWQADSLAAALLMPKIPFSYATREALRNQRVFNNMMVLQESDSRVDAAIAELAGVFQVSKRAATIRIKQLGLLNA